LPLPAWLRGEREQVRDEIDILIPADEAAFHVTYKTAEDV
jgi:hypothetical protein